MTRNFRLHYKRFGVELELKLAELAAVAMELELVLPME